MKPVLVTTCIERPPLYFSWVYYMGKFPISLPEPLAELSMWVAQVVMCVPKRSYPHSIFWDLGTGTSLMD